MDEQAAASAAAIVGADWNRSSGSLAIACSTTATTAGATSTRSWPRGTGAPRAIDSTNASGVSAAKGGWPASASKSTTPTEYRSLALVAGWPARRSGARYAAVPNNIPVVV